MGKVSFRLIDTDDFHAKLEKEKNNFITYETNFYFGKREMLNSLICYEKLASISERDGCGTRQFVMRN